MDRSKSIALVGASLFLLIVFAVFRWLSGPSPVLTYGVIASLVLFAVVCGVVIWFAIRSWRTSWQEMGESEEAFLHEAEREVLNGPRVLSEKVVLTGATDPAATDGQDTPGVAGAFGETSTPAPEMAALPASPLLSASQGPRERPGGASFAPGRDTGAVLETGEGAGTVGGSSALEKLVADLRRIGVLTSYEGKVDLPPPAAPGLIYGLRQGGLALLLEELEGHRFLAFQAKRFRAIIVRGPEGLPLVVQRYEDFVTDELSSLPQ